MDYLVFGEAILYLPHLHGLSKQAYLEKLHYLVALLPVNPSGVVATIKDIKLIQSSVITT